MFYPRDTFGYLKERWADGIPPSSPKTRRFSISDDVWSRDRAVLFNRESDFLVDEKRDILASNLTSHQCIMELEERVRWAEVIMDATGVASHSLGAVCELLPSDVVVCRRKKGGGNEIALCHLLFPNGWAAEEAIGKSFAYFHEGVKRNGKNMFPDPDKFVDHLIESGENYERVGAYSFRTNPILYRHPKLGMTDDFDNIENLFVRFERQCIMSVPSLQGFAFFIQTFMVDMAEDPQFFLNAIGNADENLYPKEVLAKHGDKITSFLKNKLVV